MCGIGISIISIAEVERFGKGVINPAWFRLIDIA